MIAAPLFSGAPNLTLRDVDGAVLATPQFSVIDFDSIAATLSAGTFLACVSSGIRTGGVTLRRNDDDIGDVGAAVVTPVPAAVPVTLATPDLDCFSLTTTAGAQNVVRFVPNGGCGADVQHLSLTTVRDGNLFFAENLGSCRLASFSSATSDVICVSSVQDGTLRGTLFVDADDNGPDRPATLPLPAAVPGELAFTADADCYSFATDAGAPEVVVRVDGADCGVTGLDGGNSRRTEPAGTCPRLESDTGGLTFCVRAPNDGPPPERIGITVDADDNGAGHPADGVPGEATAVDISFPGDVDCVRFVLDAPADVVARVGKCRGPHDLRLTDDGLFSTIHATASGEAGRCGALAASLPAGAHQLCVGADDVGPLRLTVEVNDDGPQQPVPVTLPVAQPVVVAGPGDVACLSFAPAAGQVVVVTSPDDVACASAPVTSSGGATGGLGVIGLGCGAMALGATDARVCVQGQAAANLLVRIDDVDVDAADAVPIGRLTRSTLRLADADDEDCLLIDEVGGGAFSGEVTSLQSCSTPTLTVRDADEPTVVVGSATGACSARLDVDVTGPILVCARATTATPALQQLDLVVDGVGGRFDTAVVPLASLDDGLTFVADGSVDRDCFTLANPTVTDRVVTFDRQIECRGSALQVFTAPSGNAGAGVRVSIYDGNFSLLPDFDTLTPRTTIVQPDLSLGGRAGTDLFALRFEGTLDVPAAGAWTFRTTSDDGSRLLIDGVVVVDNDGLHGATEVARTITLDAGPHAIEVQFFEASGGDVLVVEWEGPGTPREVIPASALTTPDGAVLLASATDCGPAGSIVFPAGPLTLCVQGPSTGITFPVDDRSDLVDAQPVPLSRAAVPGSGLDCQRVSITVPDTYDLVIRPDDGDCGPPARLAILDLDGRPLVSSTSDGCSAITATLDAGDVLVCADVDVAGTLRFDSASARERFEVLDQCGEGTENNFTRLFCPEGVIETIVAADWGNAEGSCLDGFALDPGCSADVRDNVLWNDCLGLQECFVFGESFFFGDPCAGVGKRLVVDYTCSGDPAPLHQWTFNDGTADDAVGSVDGVLSNGASVVGGALVLDGVDDFVRTSPITEDIGARTLVVWTSAANLAQGGGGVATLENFGTFDGLGFGEGTAGQWTATSESFARTRADNGGAAETSTGRVQVAITWDDAGTVRLFRDGVAYGTPTAGTQPAFFFNGFAELLFGLRDGGQTFAVGDVDTFDAFYAGTIDEVRLYGRALTPAEVADIARIGPVP